MQRVKYYTTLWFGYQRLGFLSMTQYPLDTFILILSMLLREASGFLGVISVAYAAGGIGNWGVYEISLLFSMCAIIEAIGQAFLDNVWGIRHLVKDGNLDTMLVRPAPLFFQVIGDVAHHQAVISMLFYFSVLFYSMNHLNIEWSFAVVFFLVEFLICGTIINTGIYTIFNCLNFWVVQGEDKTEYEAMTYEGYGPGGVAVMVETLTDNRNRTAADLRHYFDKNGGNLGTMGCVGFMFTQKGVIVISLEDKDPDEAMMDALDAGAEDFDAGEDAAEITTDPEIF